MGEAKRITDRTESLHEASAGRQEMHHRAQVAEGKLDRIMAALKARRSVLSGAMRGGENSRLAGRAAEIENAIALVEKIRRSDIDGRDA